MKSLKRYTENEVFKSDVLQEVIYSPDYSEFVLLRSKRIKGFELSTQKKKKKLSNSLECSLSRSKKSIRDYALCNKFDYFYTQTFNSNLDRFDLEEVVSSMKKKFKAFQRKYSDFKYLVIYEKHKNDAIHLHGLIMSVPDEEIKTNSNGYLELPFFSELGFNSVSKIRDNIKCANYITKYISKDMVRTKNNQVYFCSRGLTKPTIIEYNDYDLKNFELIYQNDWVKKFRKKGAL